VSFEHPRIVMLGVCGLWNFALVTVSRLAQTLQPDRVSGWQVSKEDYILLILTQVMY